MADNFFENLKQHINEKLWQQLDIFHQVADKLSALYYPKASQWAQSVAVVSEKMHAIAYEDLSTHSQITELNKIKSGFENTKGDYAQEMIAKIDTDIASHLSNGYLNYLVTSYGSLKNSFQEYITLPLKQSASLLSEVTSSLFVYIKLIEQQLTNLSGMLPKLIHAQTLIPAIASGKEKEEENIGFWAKTKNKISSSIFDNIFAFFRTSILDKIEQFAFNTKNFNNLFKLLHNNLPMQNLKHHNQNMAITNTPPNQLVVVAQQLENRFSISKLLNGAWGSIFKTDEKRSDLFSPKQLALACQNPDKKNLDLLINPDKMKFVLTNKIASFCAELQNLLTLLKDTSNTHFFSALKMWHTIDKSLPLCELTLKKLYDQLKHFVSQQSQMEISNIHIEKCRVACEGILKSIDMVTTGIALAQPFIDQTDFGHASVKNILLTSELFLGLQTIDENIAFFDILKEKIEAEVVPEIYAPKQSGLEQLGYQPKSNMQASGGKQKKAMWSGFYIKSANLYYLKHVTDYDFLADDLVEVITSNVATALGLGHRVAQCHHVRSEHNEVFVASLCTPGFKPIMNTEGRFTSRLTPNEKEYLDQALTPYEKAELSEILALSFMLGDYDCNVGNVGRTTKQGLVKIDHGWALEHICTSKQIVLQQELDPFRYLNRIAPTNNFNDYKKIIKTEHFLNKVEELIKRFNKEKINITLCETVKNFYLTYEGANIPKGVDKSIFMLFDYDQNVPHLGFNRQFEKTDIEKALNERLGQSENLPLDVLANKISETFELRLHLLKMILLISLFKKLYSNKLINSDIALSSIIEKRIELRQKTMICFGEYFKSNPELIMPFLRTSDQELLTKILSNDMAKVLLDEKKSADSCIYLGAKTILPNSDETLVSLNQLVNIYLQTKQNQASFAKALYDQPEIFFLNRDQHLPKNIIRELLENKAPNVIVEQLADSPYCNQLMVKLFLTRFKKNLLNKDALDQNQVQQLLMIEQMLAELNQHSELKIELIDGILLNALPDCVTQTLPKMTEKLEQKHFLPTYQRVKSDLGEEEIDKPCIRKKPTVKAKKHLEPNILLSQELSENNLKKRSRDKDIDGNTKSPSEKPVKKQRKDPK